MKVIARKGLRVPMETGLRRYVTDTVAVDVPNTVYYRRRISDGDLLTDPAVIAKQEASAQAADMPARSQTVAPDAGAVVASDKNTAKGA